MHIDQTLLSRVGKKLQDIADFANNHHPDTVQEKIGALDIQSFEAQLSSIREQMDDVSRDLQDKTMESLLRVGLEDLKSPYRKAYDLYKEQLAHPVLIKENQVPYSTLPIAAKVLADELHGLGDIVREDLGKEKELPLRNFSLHTAFFVGLENKSEHLYEFIVTLLDSAYSIKMKQKVAPYLTDRLLVLAGPMGAFVSDLLTKTKTLSQILEDFQKGGKDISLIVHGTPFSDVVKTEDLDPILQQGMSGFLHSTPLAGVLGGTKQDFLDTVQQRNEIMKEWLAAQVNRIKYGVDNIDVNDAEFEKIEKAISTYKLAMANLTKELDGTSYV